MKQAQVGIIGGTGIGEILLEQPGGELVHVDTPFGSPSAPPIVAEWEGVPVAFIARHGPGHRYNPSTVPYRANVWAMKRLGVSSIIASGATGSLREEIGPGHLVLCDQLIDRTFRRAATFFDEGLAAHVEFAEPFCPVLRSTLTAAGQRLGRQVHPGGTYICMEGPQFSTRAESMMHRQWGGDVIGMTACPEAKLAREAQICYALVALPTDYDCWRPPDPGKPAETILAEIMGNLKQAADNAIALFREALKLMQSGPPEQAAEACRCRESLKLAVWTDPKKIDPVVRKRLEPLLGPRPADKNGDVE